MKWELLLGVCLLVGGFSIGRFSAPEHVRTVDREVVRTVQLEDTASRVRVQELAAELSTLRSHVRVERVFITKPDGSREVHEVAESQVDKSSEKHAATDSTTDERSSRVVETVREVTKEKVIDHPLPSWRVGPLVGVSLSDLKRPSYGAVVERRLIGPVFVGGWGLSSGQFGAVLTLEF